MRIWPCKVFLFIPASAFLHAVKSYSMGPMALLPPKERHAVNFYCP
jgi:hypothetical protein